MASLNKVFLMGNLTRDPEVRHTPKGTAVGDLAMAINMSYKAQDGTEKEEAGGNVSRLFEQRGAGFCRGAFAVGSVGGTGGGEKKPHAGESGSGAIFVEGWRCRRRCGTGTEGVGGRSWG